MCQVFYYKMLQLIFFITKCDSYYKMRRLAQTATHKLRQHTYQLLRKVQNWNIEIEQCRTKIE